MPTARTSGWSSGQRDIAPIDSSDSEDAELTGKIPYGSMNRICWLHSPLGSSYEGSNATCPQIIVFNYTVAKFDVLNN